MQNRKRPKGSTWSFLYETRDFGGALVFRHDIDGSLALSSIGHIQEEKTDEPHWEWIVSFSGAGGTVLPNRKIKQYLEDFSFSDAEEDNHEAGFARKFFLAVEEKHRKKCVCKDEEQVRLSKNYVYSKKKKEIGDEPTKTNSRCQRRNIKISRTLNLKQPTGANYARIQY